VEYHNTICLSYQYHGHTCVFFPKAVKEVTAGALLIVNEAEYKYIIAEQKDTLVKNKWARSICVYCSNGKGIGSRGSFQCEVGLYPSANKLKCKNYIARPKGWKQIL
jgi:hypothetical protein